MDKPNSKKQARSTLNVNYRCLLSTSKIRVNVIDDNHITKERGNIINVDKKDVLKRDIPLVISDLFKGNKYYIEILAYDKKNLLIDRSYIISSLPEAENSFTVTPLTGMWEFNKPVTFGALTGDKTPYNGVVFSLLKDVAYNESHECVLVSGDKRTKICNMVMYYSDSGVHIYPSSVDGSIAAVRTVSLDRGIYNTSIGPLQGYSSSVEVNSYLDKSLNFLSADAAEILFCEFVISRVYKKAVIEDTEQKLTMASNEFELLFGKIKSGDVAKDSFPIAARDIVFLDYFIPCSFLVKVFCARTEGKNVEMVLDGGHLYLYPMTIRRAV